MTRVPAATRTFAGCAPAQVTQCSGDVTLVSLRCRVHTLPEPL